MRVLANNLTAALSKASRRTALELTLGNNSKVYYSTGEFTYNSVKYEGKLETTDALNLEATDADEGVNLRITNTAKTLGQWLINGQNILDGTVAVLKCYFHDSDSNISYLDTKLPGFIDVGDIDENWINIFFQSLGAKVYQGKTIAELFPDAQIPAAEKPLISPTVPSGGIAPGLPSTAPFSGGGGGSRGLPRIFEPAEFEFQHRRLPYALERSWETFDQY
jgi:hypothetical protein